MDQEEKDFSIPEEQTPEAEIIVQLSAEDTQEDKGPVVIKKKTNVKKSIMTYLHDLVYLLAVVLLLFLLCFRVVVVSGPSMNHTLVNGDYLLLLGGVFYDDYDQGDIVVASKSTFRNGEPIVKRVIATAGQTVDIDFETGVVYVDDVPINEPYVSTPTNLYEGIDFPVVVDENHVFVMGDNRNNSKDSRSPEIGQIDLREILGKAIFLIFPGEDENTEREFDRIGVIG